MSSGPTLQWFESVCIELERNPAKATKEIMEFREQDYALEACHTWMQAAECTPMAQFQLVLVMRYSAMKNWPQLSAGTVQAIRDTLWNLIQGAILTGVMPSFAMNTIMQIYALLWKRAWCDVDSTAHESALVQLRTLCMTNHQDAIINARAFTAGAKLASTLVHEFGSRSTTESGVGLPLEFHKRTHALFEQYGLNECLALSHYCLDGCTQRILQSRQALTATPAAAAAAAPIIPLMKETTSLCIEVMNWTFESLTSATQADTAGLRNASESHSSGSHNLQLPRAWATVLLSETLQVGIFQVYSQVRDVCLQMSSSPDMQSQMRTGAACLTELRLLMMNLASLAADSPLFSADAQKLELGENILKAIVPMLNSAVSTVESGGASSAAASLSGAPAATRVFDLELCSLECGSFASIIIRLLGNFKIPLCVHMPAFESAIVSLGRSTYSLSRHLTTRAEAHVHALLSGAESHGSDSDDLTLFQSWCGESIGLFLDGWCLVLDDELLVDPEQSSAPISLQVRSGIASMSSQVFSQLFDCFLHSTIWEALSEQDEDEDEEEEGIDSKSRDELLRAVCTAGRVTLEASLDYVSSTLTSVLAEAESMAGSAISGVAGRSYGPAGLDNACLRILEILRVSLLFSTHLIVDDFHTDISDLAGMEEPTIPQLIIDSAMVRPLETRGKLFALYGISIRILRFQLQLLSTEALRGHPLVSGYLLQTTLRFMREFILRFVFPDAKNYNPVNANCALFQAPDDDFKDSVELLLHAAHALVLHMPLQTDVVSAVAHLITALSKCRPQPDWAQAVIRLSPVADIVSTITDSAASGAKCRLNLLGRAQVFGAVASLAVRARQTPCFMQLCSHVHAAVMHLSSVGGAVAADLHKPENQYLMETSIACLQGLARTPSGLDKVLRELFDSCLPLLVWCWCLPGFAGADDAIAGILDMLRDYAEHKLLSMPQASSLTLFRASSSVLQIIVRRLQTPLTVAAMGSQAALEEEDAWRSKILLTVLELLNHLVAKDIQSDFAEDDDEGSQTIAAFPGAGITTSETNLAIRTEVTGILIFAFQSLVPVMTVTLLRTYPRTCDRYFAFVTFMLNSYSAELGKHFASSPPEQGAGFYSVLMQHLLWASGAVEQDAARFALQAIQSLASVQHRTLRVGGIGLGIGIEYASPIFTAAIDRLLEMIFYPRTAEYGIGWGRVDHCGGALLSLVALDSSRFLQTAHAIVAQFASIYPTAQQALFMCFEKLTTANGVDMSSLDLSNRRKFQANFNEFMQAIRPLIQV
jgi:hypothetical protein